jgi:hypothetical protein
VLGNLVFLPKAPPPNDGMPPDEWTHDDPGSPGMVERERPRGSGCACSPSPSFSRVAVASPGGFETGREEWMSRREILGLLRDWANL